LGISFALGFEKTETWKKQPPLGLCFGWKKLKKTGALPWPGPGNPWQRGGPLGPKKKQKKNKRAPVKKKRGGWLFKGPLFPIFARVGGGK